MAAAASRSCSQSSTSATTRARFARIVDVACARLLRSCESASASRAATGNAGIPTNVPLISPASSDIGYRGVTYRSPFLSVVGGEGGPGGTIGGGQHLCQVHEAYAGPLPGQQTADVHQARRVTGDQHL